MGFWAGLLALFNIPIVGAVIAGVLSLIGISILGVFLPSLKTLFVGLVLLAMAYFVPDVYLIKTDKAKVTLRNVLGIAGLLCLINLAFGISLPSFGAGTITAIASAMPTGSMFDGVKASLTAIIPQGVEAESVMTIVTVFIATIAVAYLLGNMSKRGRR